MVILLKCLIQIETTLEILTPFHDLLYGNMARRTIFVASIKITSFRNIICPFDQAQSFYLNLQYRGFYVLMARQWKKH